MSEMIMRVNKVVFFRIAVLLSFGISFIFVSLSGKAELYVNPKLVPFLIACGFIFIAMALSLVRDLKKGWRKARISFSMLIFLPPLIMALLLPAKPIISSYTNFYSVSNSYNEQDADKNSTSLDENEENTLKIINNIIILDDSNFYTAVDELYSKTASYVGMQIELKGFVYKDTEMRDNEFIAARTVMACCAADTQTIGFLCKYKYSNMLKKDSWQNFSGELKLEEYEGKRVPVIYIRSVKPISKPKVEYIYPF